MSLVTKEKQHILKEFRHIIDCKLSLYAEVWVRKQITNQLGIQNSEIVFDNGKYGKPYLENYPEFYFRDFPRLGRCDIPRFSVYHIYLIWGSP